MGEEQEKADLKPKQKKFADFYLNEALFNGTKAAELAGYTGNKNTLGVTAYDLLRNPKIKAYIEAQLASHAMGVNETIARLAEIARGNIDDVQDENGHFDIKLTRERNKTHLLKKVKQKRTIRQKKTEVTDNMRTFLAEDEIGDIETEVEIIYEEIEYEIHDAHAALRDIGKIHKIFTEKIEQSGTVNHNISGDVVLTINDIYGDDGESGDS